MMSGMILPYPYPWWDGLYKLLKEICKKRKSARESEGPGEKIKTIKQLHDEGLITEDQCKKTIDKVLETYSTQSVR